MKLDKRLYWIIFISILLISSYFVYRNLFSPAERENKIVFGISPFQDTMMPYLGVVKGWYQEEGLDVEFKILGWTEVQEALSSRSSNRIDIGINNISSIIATHNKNPDLIYYYGINTFDDGFALMIRPNGSLQPLKFYTNKGLPLTEAIRQTGLQLKGKTVITTSNTDMEQGVAAIAKRSGLNFKDDIKIVDLNPDEGLAAFLAGEGDAFIGGVPQRTKAKAEGMMEMITGSNIGPAPINGIVTTKQFANKNQQKLLKLIKVWFRIVNYTNDNLDEVASIIVKEMNKHTAGNITVEDFKLFWNKYEHYPASPDEIQKEILSPDGKNYWKARWDDCNFYFHDVKQIIPRYVDPGDAFYMPEVQKQLLLQGREKKDL